MQKIITWQRIQKGSYVLDGGVLTICKDKNGKLPWALHDAAGTVLARGRTLTECKAAAADMSMDAKPTGRASEKADAASRITSCKTTGSAPKTAKAAPKFIVYTDGGCQPNPGVGGIGIVVIDAATGEMREVSRGYANTTNNRMEVIALITALEMLPDGAEATVHSDSLYAVNCWLRNWSREKNADLWPKLDAAANGKRLTVRHVRGHAGDAYNERCDELAALGIASAGLLRDDGYAPTPTYEPQPGSRPRQSKFQQPLPSLPEELRSEAPDTSNVSAYASRYHVLPGCAASICAFYRDGRRRFKDYAQLRVCGYDGYSAMDLMPLVRKADIGKEGFDFLRATLGKDLLPTLRWRCRGLTWEDSIRKTQVDAEIRANADAGQRRC